MRTCCEFDCYEYVLLILESFEKNRKIILDGINYCKDASNPDTPLLVLLKSSHCSDEWLSILLEKIPKLVPTARIDNKSIKLATRLCKKEIKNTKWIEMLESYVKMNKLYASKAANDGNEK